MPEEILDHSIHYYMLICFVGSVFEAQEQTARNDKHDGYAQLQKAPSSVPSPPSAALEDPLIASLFRHYVHVLAPWYDLNDAQNIFGTTVPSRALRNTVLFKALIAFSACHLNRTRKMEHYLGSIYHASCVEELLGALNDTSLELQEDYLAATCLLRSYEILNGADTHPKRDFHQLTYMTEI